MMDSNIHMNINNNFSNDIENTLKPIQRNSHSTDTEPEPEKENRKNNYQNVNLSNNQVQNNTENKSLGNKKTGKSVFKSFIENLPCYEYDEKQIRKNQQTKTNKKGKSDMISMNLMDTNNNRFLNYYEAFLYIAEHCQKNHQAFTTEICKKYLKQCYIIDFAHDGFIPITKHLSPKLFKKYFLLSKKELKYL